MTATTKLLLQQLRDTLQTSLYRNVGNKLTVDGVEQLM